jgi:hypothetical protein
MIAFSTTRELGIHVIDLSTARGALAVLLADLLNVWIG